MKSSFLMRFIRNQQGVTLVTAALYMSLLLMATGVAIDMGQLQLIKTKLQTSVDAAALATGARASTVDLTQEANKFFNANYPENYLGSQPSPVSVSDPNGDKSLLIFNVSAEVPTTIMQLFNISSLTVNASSQVTRTTQARRGLEISLILDNTGSMKFPPRGGGGATKLDLLKSAATTMINTLYGNESTLPDTYVSLVPFAAMVHVSSHPEWMNNTRGWTGCAVDRGDPNLNTSDIYPSSPEDKFTADTGSTKRVNSTEIEPEPCGRITYSTTGETREMRPISALLSNKGDILGQISAMSLAGSTRINMGMAWGWATLSPNWKGKWNTAIADRPGDYDNNSLNKVAVLMTDGINGYATRDARDNITNHHVPEDDARLSAVCTNMKSAGVTVYTIAFDVGADFGALAEQTKNLLRSCASNPSYFFDAPDGATLTEAFQTIADSLLNLRISQ